MPPVSDEQGGGGLSQKGLVVEALIDHIKEVVPGIVGGKVGDLYAQLKLASNQDLLARFAEDAPVLTVSRHITEEEADGDVLAPTPSEEFGQAAAAEPKFSLTLSVGFDSDGPPTKVWPKSSVIFTKRTNGLSIDVDLGVQLRTYSFSDGPPFETLHAMYSEVFVPLLMSAIQVQRAGDKIGVKALKKSIGHLEMTLSHLQQDTDIPDVTLVIPQAIETIVLQAEEQGRTPSLDDLGPDWENDTVLLSVLEKSVRRWTRDVSKVTELADTDRPIATVNDEISFWLELEGKLFAIKELRQLPGVNLALDALRTTKRQFQVTNFESVADTDDELEKVTSYCLIMKDFPNHVASSPDVESVATNIGEIFDHLQKKMKNGKYPLARANKLSQALASDVHKRLLKTLSEEPLLSLRFPEYVQLDDACTAVFNAWDKHYHQFYSDVLYERKRGQTPVRKFAAKFKPLRERLEHISQVRRDHQKFRSKVKKVLEPHHGASAAAPTAAITAGGEEGEEEPEQSFVSDIDAAWDEFNSVDALDVTDSGARVWKQANERYTEKIQAVEAAIAELLSEKLHKANSSNDMFRICREFNPLFGRRRIHSAIQDYQSQLIQRVKDDIRSLHDTFKVRFDKTTNKKMSQIRGLPPVSAQIIWAKQIERQLDNHLAKVGDVLGKGWETHLEGSELRADGERFKTLLDTTNLFQEWLAEIEERPLQATGTLFDIDIVRMGDASNYTLKVNFPEQFIALAKEIRTLKWLGGRYGFKVPIKRVSYAREIERQFPYAIALKESMKTFHQAYAAIRELPVYAPLVNTFLLSVYERISGGFEAEWRTARAAEIFAQQFSEDVHTYQDKINVLLETRDKVEKRLTNLDQCSFSRTAIQAEVGALQGIIDELQVRDYCNLEPFVREIDHRVEQRLAKKLNKALAKWIAALKHTGDATASTQPGEEEPVHIARDTFAFQMMDDEMSLQPPVEAIRASLTSQLETFVEVLAGQRRLQADGFDPKGAVRSQVFYTQLKSALPGGDAELVRAYESIDAACLTTNAFVSEWLQYQALWDMDVEKVAGGMGEGLKPWQQLLTQIKRAKRKIDTPETSKTFGPITINYAQVQARVSFKYDEIHRELLGVFGSQVGERMNTFYAEVCRGKSVLERLAVDSGDTKQAIEAISALQDIKKKMPEWTEAFAGFQASYPILRRQRYAFPAGWLELENAQGQWEALTTMLGRKDAVVQKQMGSLQDKIQTQDRHVDRTINDSLRSWADEKPLSGDVSPQVALQTIDRYESQMKELQEELASLTTARDALEMKPKDETRVEACLEELQELKATWSQLREAWEKIEDIRQIPWPAVVTKRIRQKIDGVMSSMKKMPAVTRSHAAYETTMHMLEGNLKAVKANGIIDSIKSEAIKDRHWSDICKIVEVRWDKSSLLLGDVLDSELLKRDKLVMEVVSRAQGEMAVEQFLRELRDEWDAYELTLVNYQNRTKLITKWDDLFNKCKEHLQSLNSMKGSSAFKAFEAEANQWDEKLTKINTMFDVWLDVQRRWIYLEGVFTGSQDIKTMLPQASSTFLSINNDFLGLMKKVSKAPNVMDVISIPGADGVLNKMLDKLGKVEKDLRDYLEKERRKFPRFYFVGDEDLLDIIGNAKNIDKQQKHFKKMFAGINAVALNEAGTDVVGILSREAEVVDYKTDVKVAGRKINEWLQGVENEMRSSMAALLAEATIAVGRFREQGFVLEPYLEWLDKFQGQLVVLAAQVSWSQVVESALKTSTATASLEGVKDGVIKTLTALADLVLGYHPIVRRKKLEQMITELVHQRDVTAQLAAAGISSPQDFLWLQQMRFYFDPDKTNAMEKLTIIMADATFFYGFEYLGLVDKLVQTPLTDRCYLTLTQALQAKQGAAPFGPAGTGKTESVKQLGAQLGRFVLVFNCDEAFDFLAMGRIFVGLCQVGAWGCFDEFNRLEERMLSAVSQQIQNIQVALKKGPASPGEDMKVELLGREIVVHPDVGLFITMNPGYAGRSNLPDNLKKLFRNMAMTVPDRQLIAQVMLYSQGFRTAQELSRKVVPLFILCKEQLSSQSHYDFGLRSLKSVLVSSGNIKRARLAQAREAMAAAGQPPDEDKLSEQVDEQDVLITSICQTMVPKMVAEDIPLLNSLLSDVFPGKEYRPLALEDLKAKILEVMEEWHYVASETFLLKVLQVYQVTCINHGLMLVGPTGVGKSAAWRILNEALTRLSGEEGQIYIIDPKAISKEELYGNMDENTREWTDGLFTHIVRKVIDNLRGELTRRQWIIFDGDVDPEWVENLNSVLDDNKLLTLPNGERLNLPDKIRIIFEVQDLKNATLATVSRCGMIWFSEDVLTTEMYFQRYIRQLRNDSLEKDTIGRKKGEEHPIMEIQRKVAAVIEPFFQPDALISRALAHGHNVGHVMDFTYMRSIHSLLGMLNKVCRTIYEYNQEYEDFPMTDAQIQSYASKRLVYAIVWSIVGDARGSVRSEMAQFIDQESDIPMPKGDVIDYEITVPEGEWSPWKDKVAVIELEGDSFMGTNVVVPTLDTIRHEDLLATWLAEHMPIVLCGPPGSGKTMTLFSALRALPHIEVVGLNFSNETKPDLILTTLEQYCEYFKSPTGTVLQPKEVGKWVIIFCDECNLPATDAYDTVRVITFIRQLVEQNGFWHPVDKTWITLERIQFVGACNPPTDPGRVPLNPRMLRHIPVVYVDYPTAESYKMIYGTFNRAVLRTKPSIAQYGDTITDAMVDFFMLTQEKFTADMQPHYVYSPREMTRWYKGVGEALRPLDEPTVEDLVRIWAHEALRLFNDRLVAEDERVWTEAQINTVAKKHFPECDCDKALQRPILFSTWLNEDHLYLPVTQDGLREHLSGKLKAFCEEELSVELVLFNDVLDHVLRIDRVFRQDQGHVLLIGISGAGKTTIAKFVAWMNDMEIFQVKIHNKYSTKDFDEDLRTVLRGAGTKNKRIAFIMDEGNGLDTAFLERMNTLLANGEVPGLFEGDEYASLMSACKTAAREYDGKTIDDSDELYKWFSKTVMRNLHVVFTMNPSEGGLQDRATTSPALFNRCVLNWVGDWSENAYFSVAHEFTNKIPLREDKFESPTSVEKVTPEPLPEPLNYKGALVNACIYVHKSAQQISKRLRKREGRTVHITPRHFVEFINQLTMIYEQKSTDLNEQKTHLESGLQKIQDTLQQVAELQEQLAVSKVELAAKQKETEENWESISKEEQSAGGLKIEASKLGEMCAVEKEKAEKKKVEVEEELAEAEPAEIAAKAAVEKIMTKKGQTAMKGLLKLGTPPPTVQLVISAAVYLITKKKLQDDWKKCKAAAASSSFFPDLKSLLDRLNPRSDVTPKKKFDSKALSHIKKAFLSEKKWTEEAMTSASKDALPLMHWVEAIYKYANCVNNVEPNRILLAELEAVVAEKEAAQVEAEAKVNDLETRILELKKGLQRLSEETAELKHSMKQATVRAERSTQLLDSLSGERTRWAESAEGFDAQMETLVGDGFVSGAFIAYAGYFDQNYRDGLTKLWKNFLAKSNIVFKSDLSLPDYLATADDRLEWKTNSLPEDIVCLENAVMLEQYQRYPLVIDPSGQAVEFLLKQYKGIEKTSFLDTNFRKKLKDALVFGKFLLVQEAENFDSVLNPILNREIKRTGGRMLVGIADSEVDLSPEFRVILAARDASHQFPSDLCSRVTMINFTVTAASLQSQCQSQVLKSERPDKEEQRSEQLKLQGAFRLQLLQLEKSLLNSLNEAEGSILDDDKVIGELQRLKQESAMVTEKKNQTDIVMKEIDTILDEYKPVAQKCSAIYFTLEQMSDVHFLYRFSLTFFFDIFKTVLHHNTNLKGITDYGKRLAIITQDLLQITYDRVSPGMLHEHRMAFAVTLATIHTHGTECEPPEAEFRYFLGGGGGLATTENDFSFLKNITDDQARSLHGLAHSVDSFKGLADDIKRNEAKFLAWFQGGLPEASYPEVQAIKAAGPLRSWRQLLLLQAIRPDRVLAMSHIYVEEILGKGFASSAHDDSKILELAVMEEIEARTPVLLCGASGYDPSTNVNDLCDSLQKQCKQIALGSSEAFDQADKAINTAAERGHWVMLKNVHLAPAWLTSLEKKMSTIKLDRNFRLFLTSEINPKLPVNLLRASKLFVYEPAAGIKAGLMRTLSSLTPTRIDTKPTQRSRIYLLLAWFHAVTQERLRYTPLGWSKVYEFGEADLRNAADTIDKWINTVAGSKSNVTAKDIPWAALQALLTQTCYGGRIDNDIDRRLLSSFITTFFQESSLGADFELVQADKTTATPSIKAPPIGTTDQLLDWVSKLPNTQTPTWLSLPANAEVVLLAKRASAFVSQMASLQAATAEAEDFTGETIVGGTQTQSGLTGIPHWMREVLTMCEQWLQLLPDMISVMTRTEDSIKDPMFRFFEREVTMGSNLLKKVRKDIGAVIDCCNGKIKQTNDLRQLLQDLQHQHVPKGWQQYSIPRGLAVGLWMLDFVERCTQNESFAQAGANPASLRAVEVSLGGLFNPEAYITATRQAVAQANQWPLERLQLQIDCRSSETDLPSDMDRAFKVTGLRLEGAACRGATLSLSTAPYSKLPLTIFRWNDSGAGSVMGGNFVELPVYLNATRGQIVVKVNLVPGAGTTSDIFYQRGVALLCSGLSGDI
eukprot:m.374555 g.374555  ORF g.374555 m.374555 type:complete len:4634 (-) comp20005_c1_seq12:280-14181(-)